MFYCVCVLQSLQRRGRAPVPETWGHKHPSEREVRGPHLYDRQEKACVTYLNLMYWMNIWHTVARPFSSVFSVPLFFSQQWRTPARRSCWGSCRRKGPVRCAWTNWCPLSSSPVGIWWCVVTAPPACVTAPSAELSLEAAFAPSCPEADVRSHCYTGVAWVALGFFFSLCSFSHVLTKNKHDCWFAFYISFSTINMWSCSSMRMVIAHYK